MLATATLGQRAWFAWKCLARDPKGNPPAWRELEKRHGLTNGSIYKIVWDIAKRPGFAQLERVATALGTTPSWLTNGTGRAPAAYWPVEPRPPAPTAKPRDDAGDGALPRHLSEPATQAFLDDSKKLSKRGRAIPRAARK